MSLERGNAQKGAVVTPEIPGGYPELTASQLDLIREHSTETVVDPGEFVGNAGDVDFDFMARREYLRTSEAAQSVQIIGGQSSGDTPVGPDEGGAAIQHRGRH